MKSKRTMEEMAWELHEQFMAEFPFILPYIEGVKKWVKRTWGKPEMQDLNLMADYLLTNNLCDHD